MIWSFLLKSKDLFSKILRLQMTQATFFKLGKSWGRIIFEIPLVRCTILYSWMNYVKLQWSVPSLKQLHSTHETRFPMFYQMYSFDPYFLEGVHSLYHHWLHIPVERSPPIILPESKEPLILSKKRKPKACRMNYVNWSGCWEGNIKDLELTLATAESLSTLF